MYNIKKILNTIINGKSEDELTKIPSSSVDAVITSPPYDDLRDYTNDTNWDFIVFKKIARELYRVLKKGGVIIWVVGDKIENGGKSLTSYKQAIYFKELGFTIFDVLIYEKAGTSPPHPNRYFNSFEYMFIITKGKRPKTINLLKDKQNTWGGKTTYGVITRREKDGTLTKKQKLTINKYGIRTNIWRYANGRGFATKDLIAYEHPAIFPEKLVEDHLFSWTKKGDIILDPFSGSGTTGKIAKKNGRNFILIEVSKKYCQIAKKRIKQ